MDNGKFRVASGNEFYGLEGLKFPDMYQKEDGTYRTVFGPVFYHPGLIYESSDLSLSQAAKRQTGSREPDVPGFHEWLCDNQFNFVNHNETLRSLVGELKELVTARSLELADYGELTKSYVEEPHVKRLERILAYESSLEELGCDHATFVTFLEGKVKKDEVAKYNKYARLFVSLGPTSILTGGFLIRYIKDAFVVFKPHSCRFVPGPRVDHLTALFEEMMDPVEDVFMGYFSDDSCIAIRCVDGVFRAEVDFSSCDGSHMEVMFDLLVSLAADDWRLKSRLLALKKQCTHTMTLRSRCDLKELVVKLKLLAPVLYSGSTLTTILNNLANVVLYSSIRSFVDEHPLNVSDCRRLVMEAANNCGYIVTCDPVENMEELTFLKYFPAVTPLGIVPCMALGVPLRTIGTCRGDLPGRKSESYWDRVDQWNAMLIAAYIDAGQTSIMIKLRELYSDIGSIKGQTEGMMRARLAKILPFHEITKTCSFIPDEHLALRYKCSVEDVAETVDMICKSPRVHIRSFFTDLVFAKDYSLVDHQLVGMDGGLYHNSSGVSKYM